MTADMMPTKAALTAVQMKRVSFTRLTGTPARRAESALPPVASIQLPRRVWRSTQCASIAAASHHSTDTLKKFHLLASSGSAQPASLIETLLEPDSRRETPSEVPARMKLDASVTMKLGSFVELTRKALTTPTMTPRP